MIVAPAVLTALLSQPSCAGLSRRVLYGIVATESSGNPYAIHDDSSGRSYYPSDRAVAVALIVRLTRNRAAFSVGLAQIENSNWARYGVDGFQLLDASTNVAVGCVIYRENLYALRAYNTGTIAATSVGDRYAESVFAKRRVAVSSDRVVPKTKPRRLIPGVLTHPVTFSFSKPDKGVSLVDHAIR